MKIRRSLAMLSIGLVLGLGGGILGTSLADSLAAPASSAVVSIPMSPPSGTFAKLADRIKPAVINVNTERKGSGRGPM
ncbi:MAG: hypothetical protein ACREK6_06860, partial [Candidatus Rokuibacteriota bacterium]